MFKNKRLIPIFIVVFVDILSFSLILPLLPYYATSFNASGLTTGLLVASYSVFQFLAAPLLGSLSDRYGRRPVLIFSQMGTFTGFLILGSAIHLPNPLYWLFLARIIDGTSGGNLTIAQAYISDVTTPAERAKSYGLVIGVSFGLGFLMGPALGGFLSRFGYDVPAYVAAGISFVSILATTFLLPETHHTPDLTRKFGIKSYTRVIEFMKMPTLRPWLGVFFLFVLPFALYVSMFALFADRQLKYTAEQAGYFLAFVGLLGILWQGGAIGPMVKAFGERKSMIMGLACSSIGLSYLTFVDGWFKLGIVAIFFSFGNSIARPTLTSLITQIAPPDRRGEILGATTSLDSFGRIIAPILGGYLIDVHPGWLGWLGGSLFFLAFLIAISTQIDEQVTQGAHP